MMVSAVGQATDDAHCEWPLNSSRQGCSTAADGAASPASSFRRFVPAVRAASGSSAAASLAAWATDAPDATITSVLTTIVNACSGE